MSILTFSLTRLTFPAITELGQVLNREHLGTATSGIFTAKTPFSLPKQQHQ